MTDRTFDSLKGCMRQMRKDFRARERRMVSAARAAARKMVPLVKRGIPVAFGELRDSDHVEDAPTGASVVVDAPYAAGVEAGTRPHTPPLEPLIHWVELRGQAGLTSHGRVRQVEGRHANAAMRAGGEAAVASLHTNRFVAARLREELGRKGAAKWQQRASMGALARADLGADPATVALARAIQAAIRKRGTKAVHFMQRAVPEAARVLADLVRVALPEKDG